MFAWRDIYSIVLQYKTTLFIANCIALLAACLAIPLPLLLPILVDEVLLDQPGWLTSWIDAWIPFSWQTAVGYITVISVITIWLRLGTLVCHVWQTKKFTIVSKEVVFRLRILLIERLKRISMAEYETVGTGTVNAYFTNDLATIDQFLGTSISRTIVAVLMIVGAAGVLLWMNWQLGLFILIVNPFVVFITMWLGKKVKTLKSKENAAVSDFQAKLTEVLEGIYQIRAANREQYYLNKLIVDANTVKTHAANYTWKSDAASRFSFLAFLVGFDVFRAMSMFTVLVSDLSIGEMLAVFGYLWFLMGPIQEVLGIQYAYYAANAALQRINTVFMLKTEPEYPATVNPFEGHTTVSVQVENLHFSYNAEKEVLRGVNLSIQPGEIIALVGASGGGKSTMVQALLGLYPVSQGTIKYGGEPITHIGLPVVRENVATVLQHPALFNTSVRDNLLMGREADDDALWHALEIAQLKHDIINMEQGLETVLGKQGVKLSGGQRQRLAIARMILSNPKVVILDEATSALDTDTEARLHEAMKVFLAGRTTIIVAHRLSAVRQADIAYVFEDGEIIEQGHHEQLIEQSGLYAKLYKDRS